jgi:hypothetical protein
MKTSRYLITFLITAAIFVTAFYVSNRINDARLNNIRAIQENMAIDILSLETQFQLLQELSCKDIKENSVLSKELVTLSSRLSYTEGQLGVTNEEVIRLKRQYSLLEIKDMLLMKKVAAKCKLQPIFMLYFYSNNASCSECTKQGHVLTALSQKYPRLRIYSFDYNLDVPAVQTLIKQSDIGTTLPALVINDVAHNGFISMEEVEKLIPALDAMKEEDVKATELVPAKK